MGNIRQHLSPHHIPGSDVDLNSRPTSTFTSKQVTDDLSVEPMTMQDNEKEDAPEQVKIIPRLVDSAGQAAMPRGKDINLNPSSWTVEEVAQFLQINECASLADAFQEQVKIYINHYGAKTQTFYQLHANVSIYHNLCNQFKSIIYSEWTEDNSFH